MFTLFQNMQANETLPSKVDIPNFREKKHRGDRGKVKYGVLGLVLSFSHFAFCLLFLAIFP